MQAEIISIGDEMTSGERLDTNSQWLSQRLGELGIHVGFHVTVGDDLEQNVEVFRQAVDRAEIVIATGGLGPTADDLTREALARLIGRALVLDEPSLAHIRALFARRKRNMPERNVAQAMFPAGSRPIPNPEGTAPGIALEAPRAGGGVSHVFALPGVSAEMFQMWEATVAPAIVQLGGGQQVIRHRQIKCFGVGESDLEQMLPDLIRRGRMPRVGITVNHATITLRITATGASVSACQAQIEPTVATIRECLGPLVFGEGEEELQHAIARLLAARGETLATCEWGTGGLLADWLAEVPQAKGHVVAGLVVSTPAAVSQALGIASTLIAKHGSNSAELAEAMAVSCRERFAVDYALAVSEFPARDDRSGTPGQVHFALATPTGVVGRSASFAGHSSLLKSRAAKQALDLLRLALPKP